MDLGRVHSVIDVVGGEVSTRAQALSVLRAGHRLRAWIDYRQSVATRLLAADRSSFPEKDVADATGESLRSAGRVTERAATGVAFPIVEKSLAEGEISGGHIDALTAGLRGLDHAQQAQLLRLDNQLAKVASGSTVEAFSKHVRAHARQIVADDGVARFEAQQRATRLRWWTDRDTGMVCVRGEFDPDTGMRIIGRITTKVEALFHHTMPETAPSDPAERQDHLRGLALVALLDGSQSSSNGGRAEVNIVIDHQTLRERRRRPGSSYSATGGVDIPASTIERIMCNARIATTVVNDHGVATAVLDHGRNKRLATSSQRRALRAMYDRCAIPDCAVSFDHCEPHHITEWEHGGKTDLKNLLPLCSRHHHNVHEGNWKLVLDQTRHLTVTLPDGSELHAPMKIPRAS